MRDLRGPLRGRPFFWNAMRQKNARIVGTTRAPGKQPDPVQQNNATGTPRRRARASPKRSPRNSHGVAGQRDGPVDCFPARERRPRLLQLEPDGSKSEEFRANHGGAFCGRFPNRARNRATGEGRRYRPQDHNTGGRELPACSGVVLYIHT